MTHSGANLFGIAQAQLLSDLQTQGAELGEGLEFLAAED